MRLQHLAAHVAAFLIAALVPAALAVGFAQSPEVADIALSIALGHALVLGLPLFLIFRSLKWFNALAAIGMGFIIGAVPIGVLAWPIGASHPWTTGIPALINGIPTASGWLPYLQLLLLLGSFGAVAGFAFWLTLKGFGALAPVSQPIVGETPPAAHWDLHTYGQVGVAVVSVLLTVAILSMPAVTKDRTCHNMFRDGRTAVGPVVHFDLHIAPDDWPKLAALFEDFGKTRGLSFRNSNRTKPGAVQILALSLCNEQGMTIDARQQYWAPRPIQSPNDRGIGIGIFDLYANADWQMPARDIIAAIEAIWPGKITFRDGGGRIIERPESLK